MDTRSTVSINVIMMTLRSGAMARDVVEVGIRASQRHAGLCFTIAYGGSDTQHDAWLDNACATGRAQGADLRLIRAVDMRARLRQAFDAGKEWVLFMADDDPVSLNYLSSLASKSLGVGPEIATIASTVYLGVAGEHTMARRVMPLHGDTAAQRIVAFMAQPALSGVLYYPLQRSSLVGQWLASIEQRAYGPSYCDILLTTWCASHGGRAVVDDPVVQLRDESNWMGLPAHIVSDSRFYPLPEMTLFHELYGVSDTSRMWRAHPEFESLLPLLREWVDNMLSRLPMLFEQRCEVLGLTRQEEYLHMMGAVIKTLKWLQQVGHGLDFLAGLSYVEALADEVELAFLERLTLAQDRAAAAAAAGEIAPPQRVDDPADALTCEPAGALA
jgi:hypothetical protein